MEEMILPLPDRDGFFSLGSLPETLEFIEQRATVLALGPGASTKEETSRFVRELVVNSTVPIVLDADGINAFEEESELFQKASVEIIVTPHPGEMSRLTGLSTSRIHRDRIQVASEFSKTFNVHVVLKGAPTVIASPSGEVYVNPTGNPGMATAGSGDVLTGIIAGLIAQGVPPEQAARLGVFIHGKSGDLAAESLTEFSMTATDIIDKLPETFKTLTIEK
jgi:NAD(P)H-hydrate epimerase